MDAGVFLSDPHTKQRMYAKSLGQDVEKLGAFPESNARQVEKDKITTRLDAFKELNQLHKTVLIARFFHQETFSDISEVLKMNVSTVYGIYQEGVEIMKRTGYGS